MEIKDKIVKFGNIRWKDAKWFQGDLKELSRRNLERLKQSIIQHNFADPLKIWNDGSNDWILDGHQRKTALKSLEQDGYQIPEKLPAIWLDCRDEKEASEMVLIYNSQYGKITDDSLYNFFQYKQLDMGSLDLVAIPEINIEIFKDSYLDNEAKNINDRGLNEIPETPEKPRTKLGEIWQLGNHRLMCGDSMKKDDIEKLLEGKQADLVFTDPPYNVDLKHRGKRPDEIHEWEDGFSSEAYGKFLNNLCNNIDIYLREGGVFYICQGWKFYHLNVLAILATENLLYHQLIVWHKMWPVMGRTDYIKDFELIIYGWKRGNRHIFIPGIAGDTDVWQIKKDTPQQYVHLTQKPVELPIRAIRNSSVRGDIVMDFFGGSGSTLMSCEMIGRICYTMELNPQYCDVIMDRYAKLFTQDPIRVTDNKKWSELKRESQTAIKTAEKT